MTCLASGKKKNNIQDLEERIRQLIIDYDKVLIENNKIGNGIRVLEKKHKRRLRELSRNQAKLEREIMEFRNMSTILQQDKVEIRKENNRLRKENMQLKFYMKSADNIRKKHTSHRYMGFDSDTALESVRRENIDFANNYKGGANSAPKLVLGPTDSSASISGGVEIEQYNIGCDSAPPLLDN